MQGFILNRNKYIIEKTKYHSFLKYTGIFLIGFIVLGLIISLNIGNTPRVSSSPDNVNNSSIDEKYELSDKQTKSTTLNQEKKEQTKPKSETNNSLITNKSIPEKYQVTKVVDGDTIYVSGIKTRIRLIGVNTPETVSPSSPVQCFGPEASEYLSSLLNGKYVGLESDTASGDVDTYGRPLRYVYLNGENVNQKLILEGYGKEASYGTEYKYRQQFIESEKTATANKKGLWSPNTCNGHE